MNDLNSGPLHLNPEGDDVYTGSIFGVSLRLEVLGNVDPEPTGEVDIVSDVIMPLGLGRTYTVAHWRYRGLDEGSTLAELSFVLETRGLAMSIYANLRRHHIDVYLERLLQHVYNAASMSANVEKHAEKISSIDHVQRIREYHRLIEKLGSNTASIATTGGDESTSAIPDHRPWLGELTELTSLYQRYQGKAMEIEEELIRIRDTRDSVATLLIARRMLELIASRVCEERLNRKRGTEPLASVIDKLNRGNCIPEYVITSMNNLNRLSLFGAHPKEFSPRQVREALMAMCSILEWYVRYE